MAEPRKHHYLPQFYLANFADENKRFWQYEKSADAKSYGIAVKDAAAIRDFHKLDYEDGSDENAFEKELSGLEGELAEVLKQVLASKEVSDEIKPYFVQLVSSMRFRVPSVRDFLESSLQDTVKSTMELMRRRGKLPDLEKLEAAVGKDGIEIKIANWMILKYMYGMAFDPGILGVLFAMHISILGAPDGTHFITGDQPVSLFHPTHDADSVYGLPLTHEESELVMPLSTKLAAKFSWREAADQQELTVGDVREINRRTVVMAQKYMFSSAQDAAISKLVIDNHRFDAGFEGEMADTGETFFQLSKVRCVMPAGKYK